MEVTSIITTEEARKGFYPTPPEVADLLLEDVDWYRVKTILEPSAGKGDLVKSVIRKATEEWPDRHWQFEKHRFEIDAVELDPYLRSILQYEFTGPREKEIVHRIVEIENAGTDWERGERIPRDPEVRGEYKALAQERNYLSVNNLHVVHDDFLTYDSRKYYDIIIMNPPFADGDAHLLKAIELQRRNGGEVRCILNAETLINPYTNRRKVLQAQLAELGAEVQYIEGGFSRAERSTDVTVALVKVSLPKVEAGASEFFERMKKAAEFEEMDPAAVTDLSVNDFLTQIVTRYNVEVDTGLALMKEFTAMKPYVAALALHMNEHGKNLDPTVNGFLRLVRRKYWQTLFEAPQFTAKLTSKLKEKYRGMVDEMVAYDFTMFNIQQIMVEMNAEMGKGIQDTIVALFDKFTQAHTWYPEMQKNIHYYNGWKTNKAHKVGKKVIIPTHGMFASKEWRRETFEVRQAEATISDIEKVFDYLDGNMTAEVDLHDVLLRACEAGQTKKIPCKYFQVTLYQKGTMHIHFTNMELLDRFNIYCGRHKNWLPPNYGKAAYTDLSQEEKAVADSFHGDGTEGSGEKAYREVHARQQYYLAEPANDTLALIAPV